ncbi:MAG: hypothetical protein V1843_03175, partial [bacterium]
SLGDISFHIVSKIKGCAILAHQGRCLSFDKMIIDFVELKVPFDTILPLAESLRERFAMAE